MNKDDYDHFRQEYLNKKIVNIYNHLNQSELDLLEKLNLKIKNELYTAYDFDQKQSELLKYDNNINLLKDTGVTSEECNNLINIFYKIADEYSL